MKSVYERYFYVNNQKPALVVWQFNFARLIGAKTVSLLSLLPLLTLT